MSYPTGYQPSEIWIMENENGGTFSNINKPTAGATFEKELPVGKHPLQLYSLGTPNGIKITIMLEELLALGHNGAEYDAWLCRIHKGEQFSSGFVQVNPNSKIPALVDNSSQKQQRVFESGAILFYLAEKFKEFIPINFNERTECLSWLFWQTGSAPYLGGGFGHFYKYAPEKFKYAIDRFSMETKRQLDVLDQRLSKNDFISGQNYNIADIAIWSWYGQLVLGELYNADVFLDVEKYQHVMAWAKKIDNREAVKRGKIVNQSSSDKPNQLRERHDMSDFDFLK
ncbi:glutathione-dependent disulfide-bond oxidoreductase [Amylibacter sp.]|nr:glutathione-dependent disulfide-bond oxidoreductase [Amylibacter sp.]